ncbi:disintegrin and metalloproteinase domain-containing protein 19-like [Polyodon spathula]|uniref:disintegrin and metalloproteinase domain-containing protein 19-like n=1 Tax=Polyodon spathula TaxID=7913 RepID=UPI001B7EFE8C|nr:disintegrin and metalloproteinase domain-containing protein 19-like [Polyodon spathula]
MDRRAKQSSCFNALPFKVQYLTHFISITIWIHAGAGYATIRDSGWLDHQTRKLDHIVQYETIIPQWLTPARIRRSVLTNKYPSAAEIKVTAQGKDLILQIERNEQLFAPEYTETQYSPNGIPQTSSPQNSEHCFYHGSVRGMEHSSVAMSTCKGLRGLIVVNSSLSYLIEPLHEGEEQHLIYRTEHLSLRRGTCGHKLEGQEGEPSWDITGFTHRTSPHREKRDVMKNMKYVELLVVADNAEYQKLNSDYEKTKMKILEAANYVDKFYKALNIRIALIGLEIWTDRDQISISENPYSTLGSFLTWRRKQLIHRKNDNAQLITGVAFQGTTIGLAPLMAMCSEYQSGGINSDHSDNAIGVAATMAHEMGHNFGMNHDAFGCCLASPEDGGCIMAAATGHPFPKVFNRCNEKELQKYLGTGGGKCLFNMPNTKAMYGGQRCGNGYLEEGEECDCGEVNECSSPCCNANNCTLKVGAECAHGVCCDNCKLKSPGNLCRKPSGSCDLPEYCNGKSESCPANFYLIDGNPCQGGGAYCYNGMCLTLEQQCMSLWGHGAKPAPDACFQLVNEAGDTYGNCGKDMHGKYRKCETRHAKCGKIQCQTSATKPVETNAVSIDTTVTLNGQRIKCKGTHVYRSEQDGDTLDPGLVMTGTKCGENEICFEGECRNSSFLKAGECDKKCSGHGFCNNNHNCHCEADWSPPFCDKPGLGGSVDSGPVSSQSDWQLLLLLIALVLLCLWVLGISLYCCYKHRDSLQKKPPTPLPKPKELSNAVARPDPQTAVTGHANPTFKLKTQDDSDKGTGPPYSPAFLPKGGLPISRPTCSTPEVPSSLVKLALKKLVPQHFPVKALMPPRAPPSTATRQRQAPPSRPPPPCPVVRPPWESQQSNVPPALTSETKLNTKKALMPPAGYIQNSR